MKVEAIRKMKKPPRRLEMMKECKVEGEKADEHIKPPKSKKEHKEICED